MLKDFHFQGKRLMFIIEANQGISIKGLSKKAEAMLSSSSKLYINYCALAAPERY